MPISYNGTPIVPAPMMAVSEQFNIAPDGTNLGSFYQITLTGSLVAVPPGTTPVEADARLGTLLTKQAALSALFSINGKALVVTSPDGSGVTTCHPTVKSITFSEGIWVERTEYTIELEAPNLYGGTPPANVTDISDEWQIEEAGFTKGTDNQMKPLWKLTHTVAAKGRLVYDGSGVLIPAWQLARDWVVARLSTSNFAARPFNSSSELNIAAGGQGYNHARTESINSTDGSFSLTESWLMGYTDQATEDYTASIKYTPEDLVTTTVTISGVIHGLGQHTNNFVDDRMDNAIAYWTGSVKNVLLLRAQALAPGVTFNTFGVAGTLDYNYNEGTLSYNYDFNDKVVTGNVSDIYTISRKTSVEDPNTVVQVSGTIQGLLAPGEVNSSLLKYQRAKDYFDGINNTDTLFARAQLSGITDLKSSIVDSDVGFNQYEGQITYSFSFNNRTDELVIHEYTVEVRSGRDSNLSTVGISGTITGLKTNDTAARTTKYANASAFWSTWASQIPIKAAAAVPGVTLHPVPATQTKGDNSYQGVITYSYEYNTDPIPTISGAIVQKVTVSNTKPSRVFAVITVLDRPAGPILQDIGSNKEQSISVSLEVIMARGEARPNTDSVVDAYEPAGTWFVDRDEESWDVSTGHYTRTKTFVFE